VAIAEGDHVLAGTKLALISTSQELADGSAVDEQLLKAIDDEEATLRSRLAALDASEPLQQKATIERLQGIRNQIGALNKQRATRLERLDIAKTTSEAGEAAAARGVISGDNQRLRHYDYLAQEQSLGDFRAQIAQLESLAAETEASLAKIPTDTAQTRAAIRQDIMVLEEKRANAKAQNGFVLSAPMAGRISVLQARPGQAATPDKPLMTLVPDGSELQAEVFVPSRAIGFVQPGQRVRLLYDAFPHERFGPAFGTISEVSSSVLRPDEVAAAVPVREPVYRVLVVLEKTAVHAYGRDLPVLSGMALTADIILEERSFLALLLDPLLAARGRILAD
jgi:membrane fusion protein